MSGELKRIVGLTVGLVMALLALLVGTFMQTRGQMPALQPLRVGQTGALRWAEGTGAQRWFSTNAATCLLSVVNRPNPFFTLHFEPPPPPRTRPVSLLFQGSFTSSGGTNYGYVLMGNQTLIVTNGQRIVADYAVKKIAFPVMVLTNAVGRTNVLQFDKTTEVQVPVK